MKRCVEIGCSNEAEGMSPMCGPCVNKACERLANIPQQGTGGFSPIFSQPQPNERAYMNKSNNHRQNKHAFQAWLKEDEKAIVDEAKDRIGAKTDRQLLLALSRNFNANPNHIAFKD